MTKDELKEMIKQAILDMFNKQPKLEINTSGDVGGYDSPMGTKIVKRKLKDELIDK